MQEENLKQLRKIFETMIKGMHINIQDNKIDIEQMDISAKYKVNQLTYKVKIRINCK